MWKSAYVGVYQLLNYTLCLVFTLHHCTKVFKVVLSIFILKLNVNGVKIVIITVT